MLLRLVNPDPVYEKHVVLATPVTRPGLLMYSFYGLSRNAILYRGGTSRTGYV